MTAVTSIDLLRIRAALTVGLPPGEALCSARDAELTRMARMVGLGQPLSTVARTVADRQGALGAGPLLRGLALAERSGHGAVDAVDVALHLRHDAEIDELRLAARTAQATGTARVLTALPIAAWALLMAVDPAALRFYGTALGWTCASVCVLLGVAGHLWSRRLVRRAGAAAGLADPLATAAAPFDASRAAVVAVPIGVAGWVALHPLSGLLAGAAAGAWAGRPRTVPTAPPCTTVELVALLTMLLRAEAGLVSALEHLAEVTPDPLDGQLRAVGRRLRAGTGTEAAFAGTGLAEVGAVLAITEQWGVGAATPLQLLSDAVRVRQRAAAETAAERVQLSLVFPTTLLTLPAFVIAVVPPLVWTALAA
jgi:Flp pilus assembly protein TadB